MNSEVWIVSFVYEERGDTSGSAWGVMVCEFCKWKEVQAWEEVRSHLG